MIEELSKETWDIIYKRREEELQRHLRTGPLNIDKATESVNWLYDFMGKDKPLIFRFSSPMICQMFISLLKENKNLKSQLESQLGSQLRLQLSSHLSSQLRLQLSSQLESQLYSQLRSQVGSQLGSQLESQLDSQLGSQLDSQLESQLYSQIRLQLHSQLFSQLNSQLGSQLYLQLESQLSSQLDSQLRSKIYSQLYSQLRSQLDLQIYSQFYLSYTTSSSFDYYWRGYYSFYLIILEEIFPDKKKDFSKLYGLMDCFDNLSICYFFEGIAVICDRPEEINFENKKLHKENGMSVKYSDGWGIYSLNGVAVDEYYVMTPKNEIDTKKVLAIENAEQRMALIKYIGMDKFIDSFENKTIETKFMKTGLDGISLVDKAKEYLCEYNLIDIEIEDRWCRFLKMSNFTTKEWHVEGVPNECDSVENALAWREGKEIFTKPQGVA